MALHRRLHLLALPLGLGFGLGACSAFYPPGDDDDPITRCGNSDDCPGTGDNRQEALCVRGDDQGNDSEGVCVQDFVQQPCDAARYGAMSDFSVKYNDAAKADYICAAENSGALGCPPSAETGCDEGLTAEDVNGTLACVDLNAPVRQIPASIDDEEGTWRQDIQHAFCRAYFCDDRFVCNDPDGQNPTCVLCDGSDPDQGGCVEIYVNGGLSPVYSIETDNCSGDRSGDDVVLGPLPVAPT